jgi:hypothetical protein
MKPFNERPLPRRSSLRFAEFAIRHNLLTERRRLTETNGTDGAPRAARFLAPAGRSDKPCKRCGATGALDSYFLSPVASALVGVAIVALLFAGWADAARDLLYCGAAVILALLAFVLADRVRCQQCGAWDSR